MCNVNVFACFACGLLCDAIWLVLVYYCVVLHGLCVFLCVARVCATVYASVRFVCVLLRDGVWLVFCGLCSCVLASVCCV